MAGPQRINSASIPQRSYEANLQQVGGQRQLVNRRAVQTPAENEEHVHLTQDHVSLAQDASENAAHVGVLRDEDSEPLMLPAPEEQATNLPAVIEDKSRALVPVKDEPLTGEIVDAEWEPAYPGTPEQGLSPYMPGGPGGPGGPSGPGNPGGPDGPGGPGGPGGPYGGPSQADAARSYQQHQQEQEEVQKIFAQMMADRQKWMMEMWKIMQDTQTKIYEIMTSSLMYRQQVSDKMNALWSETMRGA